jgi:hypothetical protein
MDESVAEFSLSLNAIPVEKKEDRTLGLHIGVWMDDDANYQAAIDVHLGEDYVPIELRPELARSVAYAFLEAANRAAGINAKP